MEFETSMTIIALSVVVLVVFLCIALVRLKKTLESTKRDLHHVSTEAVQLMKKVEELTSDVQSKSESLNFLFKPLKALNKPEHSQVDTIKEVIHWASISLLLFKKIKAAVKSHEK